MWARLAVSVPAFDFHGRHSISISGFHREQLRCDLHRKAFKMIILHHANHRIFRIVIPEIDDLSNGIPPSGFPRKGFIHENGMRTNRKENLLKNSGL